jgi:hypothetical protein
MREAYRNFQMSLIGNCGINKNQYIMKCHKGIKTQKNYFERTKQKMMDVSCTTEKPEISVSQIKLTYETCA